MRHAFSLTLEELANYKREYSNIVEQVNEGIPIVDNDGEAGIFLVIQNQNKYFPARLSRRSAEEYVITPLIAVHCITGCGSGVENNPYSDLKKMLETGFKSTSGLRNWYVADFKQDGRYPFDLGSHSQEKPTFGDKYLLEADTLELPDREDYKLLIMPEAFFDDRLTHHVSALNIQDANLIILLNPNLNKSERKERIDFYQSDIQHPNIRFL